LTEPRPQTAQNSLAIASGAYFRPVHARQWPARPLDIGRAKIALRAAFNGAQDDSLEQGPNSSGSSSASRMLTLRSSRKRSP
jgi:hypothetical protein